MLVHVERELIHGFHCAGREQPAILEWLNPQEARTRRTVLESSIGEWGDAEQHRAFPLPIVNLVLVKAKDSGRANQPQGASPRFLPLIKH
jgi:hypothetical protein